MNAQTKPQGARIMAWLVVVLAVGLIVLGAAWYGFSAEVHQRIWRDIAERPGGPMSFRFLLQPTMAFIAALHDGIQDARTGRAPYFWTVLSNPSERSGRLREGLLATARLVLIGLVMDVIYQWRVLGTFYPGEALLVALLLAVLPYFLLRGPVNRIARRFLHPSPDGTR
jgi:hypothetical protein